MQFARLERFALPAMVNGSPGVVAAADGRVMAVVGVTVQHGRIAELDILADRERLRHLDRSSHGLPASRPGRCI